MSQHTANNLVIPENLTEFLHEYPELLPKLSPEAQAAFITICQSISHLRSRQSRNFFITTFNHIAALHGQPREIEILQAAQRLSTKSWMLIDPFLQAAPKIGLPDFIPTWADCALALAAHDVDVALTFLIYTPQALKAFGPEKFFQWSEPALHVLAQTRHISRAVRAYLEEAVSDRCAISLDQWMFSLQQAVLIAKMSPKASEAYIRLGSRLCLLLSAEETSQWIQEGLTTCRNEDELINYFSGTSLKALEKRDSIASGVALKDRSNTLSLICEALLAKPVRIRSNTSLIGVKGFSGGAATDGRVIYLPDVSPDFVILKLMALHQAMLLDHDDWRYEIEKAIASPAQIHWTMDKLLLKRLPSLLKEMQRYMDGAYVDSYPYSLREELPKHMPWWGDLLPHLVAETDETIRQIQVKAADQETDLPPEVIEALIASMMAAGEREVDGLWARLMEMLNSIEFTSPDPEELEESAKTFFYKEWDETLADYKLDWTLVRQRFAKDDPNPFVADIRKRLHGLINLIRRQFTRLKPERFKRYRAQPLGDDLDIDALVQAIVDLQAHSFLSENVYIRRDKHMRDVVVLFLVDMSASTAEQVNGRRVIDIEKEAMTLMAEALDSLGDAFAIFGFSSEGRFRIDLFTVKEFGEPYNEQVQYRLGNLEPKELTRLGAVIRHGIYKLDNTAAAVKLMVILTDGRPYDLEYGSLDYALADTRKAMQEARNKKIHTFIITSDKKGASYLRRISPQTQSIILPDVQLLPAMLPNLYKRLTI